MINQQLIITYGSKRQSNEFLVFLDKISFEMAHIVEDKGDGYSKTADELLEETLALIEQYNLPVKAFISFGRATVIDGIPNIVECWRQIKKKPISHIKNAIYLGPSYMAGKCIPDKWLATEIFKLLNLPISETEHIDLNDNKLCSLPFPFVLKPTRFSGGAGMKYVENDLHYKDGKTKLKKLDENQAIVTEYIQGIELSVEILRLGNKSLIYPIGTKQFTHTSLSHAENKVRIYGYLKPIPHIEKDAIKIAEALDIEGLLSVEGIVYDSNLMKWKIIEAATRVSGNLPMEQASTNIFAFKKMAEYLQGKNLDTELKNNDIAIEISIYNHNNEKTVKEFLALPWVKRSLLNDLSKLPGSEDRRKRVSVGFMGGKREDLQKRCHILEKISGDNTILNRVTMALKEINDFFGDYVIDPYVYNL